MYFPAQIYNDIMKEVLTHVAPHGYSRQFFFFINYNSREVSSIARTSAPINVIVHYPKTEEGKQELAIRVASIHADMVNQHINQMNIPSSQKVQLLDEIIKSAYKEMR